MAEGTTLGKAYIQIMPSAEGIKSSIESAIGADVENAGKSAGGKWSGAFKKAAQVGAAALTAAAAGVAALTKASLDSYADYEQLVGGVETLFKDSADIVQQYAANAYTTAGLSANEYMETVTSFSASLLQGLEGDTKAAAEVANVAITDMSDNANKMGTDMGLIQNAYQGFAKQNYTMLDNLKLGYGGTQAEMARLINDSGVLGETVKVTAQTVNSVSYDKIIEAIHTVQTEMSISGLSAEEAAEAVASGAMTEEEAFNAMGTTAKEASTTIQGSLNMMKGAWSNLLTGIADENADLNGLIDNLVASVGTAADNILPRITQILSGIGTMVADLAPIIADELPGLIETAVPALLTAGGSLLTGLIQGIITAIPTLATSAVQVVTQLVTYLIENVPTLVQAAGTLVQALVTGIMEALPQLLSAGGQMLSELVNGIIEGLPGMIERLPEVINGFLGFITEQLPSVLDMGVELLTNLAYGIINAIPEFVAQLPAIFESFVGFIVTNLPMIVDAGITLLENLLIGIIQAIPEFVAQLPTIIENFTNVIIANLPVIINAGVTLLEHLVTGIIHAIPELVANLPKIINSIVDGLSAQLGAIWDIGANIVKGLWEGIQSLAGWLWEKVSGWISGIWDGIKEFFGISSPSKEMAWIGEMMAQGLAGGISDNARDAVNAAKDMSRQISDVGFSMGGDVRAAGSSYETTNNSFGGVTINIQTSQGLDVNALADIIMDRLTNMFYRKAAQFA